MGALVNAFVEIVLRRRGPDILPASGFLLGTTLIAYVSLGAVGLLLFDYDMAETGLSLLVDLGLILAFSWIVLFAWGRLPRLQQTLTALFGTGALFSVPQIPLTLLARSQQGSDLGSFAVILLFALIIWQIVVYAHIIQRAIEQTLAVAVILVMIHFFANFAIFQLFLPAE